MTILNLLVEVDGNGKILHVVDNKNDYYQYTTKDGYLECVKTKSDPKFCEIVSQDMVNINLIFFTIFIVAVLVGLVRFVLNDIKTAGWN